VAVQNSEVETTQYNSMYNITLLQYESQNWCSDR